MKNIRGKISLVVSIIAFGFIYFGFDTAADAIGVPTYIDFDETITVTRGSGRYSYEVDIDGESTDVGIYIMIASIMLAWRIYHWVLTGKVNGEISRESHITWMHWLLGMMEVSHGGFEIAMPHVTLHDPRVDSSLKQVGGITMAQCMNGYPAFHDARGISGLSEGALHSFNGHDLIGGGGFCVPTSPGRKNQGGIAVVAPVLPQDTQCVFRQRHITILGPLAAMDVKHHSGAVDI